jgi:hypothetical protein
LEFEPDPSRYALDLVAWLDRHFVKTSDRDLENMQPTNRELRELKREIKRAGNQRRRRHRKRVLRENPEEAANPEENSGRYPTLELNGIDRDRTRGRD